MNKCIIIVPIYKEKLNYDEEQLYESVKESDRKRLLKFG